MKSSFDASMPTANNREDCQGAAYRNTRYNANARVGVIHNAAGIRCICRIGTMSSARCRGYTGIPSAVCIDSTTNRTSFPESNRCLSCKTARMSHSRNCDWRILRALRTWSLPARCKASARPCFARIRYPRWPDRPATTGNIPRANTWPVPDRVRCPLPSTVCTSSIWDRITS